MASVRMLRPSADAILVTFTLTSCSPIVESPRGDGISTPRVEDDTGQAINEIESKRRSELLIPEDRTAPTRSPALDQGMTQGIQSRGPDNALGR